MVEEALSHDSEGQYLLLKVVTELLDVVALDTPLGHCTRDAIHEHGVHLEDTLLHFEGTGGYTRYFELEGQDEVVDVDLLVRLVVEIYSEIAHVAHDALVHQVFLFLVRDDQHLPVVIPLVVFCQVLVFVPAEGNVDLCHVMLPEFVLELAIEDLVVHEKASEFGFPYC